MRILGQWLRAMFGRLARGPEPRGPAISLVREASRPGGAQAALDQALRQGSAWLALDEHLTAVDGQLGLGLTYVDRSLVVVDASEGLTRLTADRYGAGRLVGAEVVETVVDAEGAPWIHEVLLRVFLEDGRRPCVELSLLGGPAPLGSPEHRAARLLGVRWEGLIRSAQAHGTRKALEEARLRRLEDRVSRGELGPAEAQRERARIRAERIVANRGLGALDPPSRRHAVH